MHTLLVAAQVFDAVDAPGAVDPRSDIGSAGIYPAERPAEFSPGSNPSTQRDLPDPAICLVKATGIDGYADCLVKNPFACRHALSFGYGFFCRHPKVREMIRSTSRRGLFV